MLFGFWVWIEHKEGSWNNTFFKQKWKCVWVNKKIGKHVNALSKVAIQ
jgi:hypothetical protein